MSFVFLFVVFALLITALYYLTKASSDVTKADNYKSDDKLKQAHSYLVWSVVAMWITLALLVTGVVLGFVFGGEAVFFQAGGWIANILTFILLFLCFFVGVIAAVSAALINSTPNGKTGKGKDAYMDCIIASIITFGLLFLIVAYYFVKYEARRHAQKKKLEEDRQRNEALKEGIEQYVVDKSDTSEEE